jgi:ArsR family metal-binding transcriptional regulator
MGVSPMSRPVIREQGYSFYLVNIDCLPTSTHFNVVMNLEHSIVDLMPYLAACLPACTYVHGTGVINLMDGGHIVAIYPGQITITDVSDGTTAARLCRDYFAQIAHVLQSQDQITPVYEKRLSLSVLDIFRLLPGTNCGRCQTPTCLAFAAKVHRRESVVGECEPLLLDSAGDNCRKLLQKLRANGYETPAVAECGMKSEESGVRTKYSAT